MMFSGINRIAYAQSHKQEIMLLIVNQRNCEYFAIVRFIYIDIKNKPLSNC